MKHLPRDRSCIGHGAFALLVENPRRARVLKFFLKKHRKYLISSLRPHTMYESQVLPACDSHGLEIVHPQLETCLRLLPPT